MRGLLNLNYSCIYLWPASIDLPRANLPVHSGKLDAISDSALYCTQCHHQHNKSKRRRRSSWHNYEGASYSAQRQTRDYRTCMWYCTYWQRNWIKIKSGQSRLCIYLSEEGARDGIGQDMNAGFLQITCNVYLWSSPLWVWNQRIVA